MNQPIVVFLDDSRERSKTFYRINSDKCKIYYVDDSRKAIHILKELDSVDYLMLDHDLRGEDTGMKVVDFLVENKKDIHYIYIHSTNTPASHNMHGKLAQAGYEAGIPGRGHSRGWK